MSAGKRKSKRTKTKLTINDLKSAAKENILSNLEARRSDIIKEFSPYITRANFHRTLPILLDTLDKSVDSMIDNSLKGRDVKRLEEILNIPSKGKEKKKFALQNLADRISTRLLPVDRMPNKKAEKKVYMDNLGAIIKAAKTNGRIKLPAQGLVAMNDALDFYLDDKDLPSPARWGFDAKAIIVKSKKPARKVTESPAKPAPRRSGPPPLAAEIDEAAARAAASAALGTPPSSAKSKPARKSPSRPPPPLGPKPPKKADLSKSKPALQPQVTSEALDPEKAADIAPAPSFSSPPNLGGIRPAPPSKPRGKIIPRRKSVPAVEAKAPPVMSSPEPSAAPARRSLDKPKTATVPPKPQVTDYNPALESLKEVAKKAPKAGRFQPPEYKPKDFDRMDAIPEENPDEIALQDMADKAPKAGGLEFKTPGNRAVKPMETIPEVDEAPEKTEEIRPITPEFKAERIPTPISRPSTPELESARESRSSSPEFDPEPISRSSSPEPVAFDAPSGPEGVEEFYQDIRDGRPIDNTRIKSFAAFPDVLQEAVCVSAESDRNVLMPKIAEKIRMSPTEKLEMTQEARKRAEKAGSEAVYTVLDGFEKEAIKAQNEALEESLTRESRAGSTSTIASPKATRSASKSASSSMGIS
ncbi:MAG: hypothetical protein RLN62_05595 [Rickettsiales bacterium]